MRATTLVRPGAVVLALVLALGGCAISFGDPGDGPSPGRPAPAPVSADRGGDAPAAPATDAVGLVPPHPPTPTVAWEITPQDLGVPGAGTVEFYDPTATPTIEGWPLVGVVDAGEVWVVGVADPGGANQWLVTLDPATGERRAVVGLTRAAGPPSSCTPPLADGRMACLYGDVLDVIDPAAGEVSGRVELAEPAFSVHAVDGEVLVVTIPPSADALTLARMDADGADRWTATVGLDFEQTMAMTGSYVPAVQEIGDALVLSIGELHVLLDAGAGTHRWSAVGAAVGPGPEGTVLASVRPEGAPGTPSELQVLTPAGDVLARAEGVTWRPAAASTGVADGLALVADDGGAIVGVSRTGARVWDHAATADQLRVPMVLAAGVSVVQDTAGDVVALDAATGAERWTNEGRSAGWGIQGWGALTDGERMIVRSLRGVLAVDLVSGQEAWRVPVPDPEGQVWELAALDGGIVAAGQRSLTVIAPAG